MWFQKLAQLFKNKELRDKILFILGVFVVFRIMANIPIPGVNIESLRQFFNNNQALGLFNIFTGGALSNFSIVMLGMGPYITSTIILQLLTMIFPALERLYREEGEAGQRKFNQYGRILTIPLAAFEGFSMIILFQHQGVLGTLSPFVLLSAIFTIVAGAMLLMWLGELITEKGLGNGVSLLIFAGIVARVPQAIYENYATSQGAASVPSYILFAVLSAIIIAGVVLITEARRNIPVSYAKRVRGNKMYGGASTYLPLNVNPAGVMPIIFALSILLFPGMIANFFGSNPGTIGSIAKTIGSFFTNTWIYGALYFLLVIVFTYFYTMVTFDPKSISENLQKMGGFIPGVRPGPSTSAFINIILNRVLFTGAVFLGIIAVLPSVVTGLLPNIQGFNFLVGGTSLLIVVSVILDTLKQINSQLEMREYDTF